MLNKSSANYVLFLYYFLHEVELKSESWTYEWSLSRHTETKDISLNNDEVQNVFWRLL